jgi:hypothetical protein
MRVTTKRYIIFSLLTALIIALSLIVYRPKKQPSEISVPSYITQIKGNLQIDTDNEIEFNVPSKTPLIQIQLSEISISEAQNIATALGFGKDPQTFDDAFEGKKYFWLNDESYLSITPNTSSISYGLNNPPIDLTVNDAQLSEELLIEKTETFLFNNFFIEAGSIKYSSTVYLNMKPPTEIVKETSKEDANVYQINFTYQDADYQIISTPSFNPIITVQLLPDGTITKTNLTKLENITNTKDVYSIKSLSDINQSLNDAVLIALKNDYISLIGLTSEDIQNISLEKVELVYLAEEPQTKILKPVFLLEGSVKVKGSTANKALLYLPAIKNP